MPALQEIFTSFTRMQFNMAVLDGIYNDFMRTDTGMVSGTFYREKIPEKLPFTRAITLENVTYNYPNTEVSVIKDINLVIEKTPLWPLSAPPGPVKPPWSILS